MDDNRKKDNKDIQEDEKLEEEIEKLIEDKEQEEAEQTEGAESLESKPDAFEEKYRRALADYQNLQRRTQEERVNWIRTSNNTFILKLLPILDTLMLANEHIKDKGITLIIQNFLSLLQQEGITPIASTVGLKYDPEKMIAVGKVNGEDGRVVEELERAYMQNGKIFRPAKVNVGSRESKVTNIPSGVLEE